MSILYIVVLTLGVLNSERHVFATSQCTFSSDGVWWDG